MLIIILLWAIVLLFILFFKIETRLENEGLEEYDHTDYSRARLAYVQAKQNFEQADPQYIDIAISDLGISENRVSNELLKKQLEGGEHDDQKTTDPHDGQPGAAD